MGGERGFPVVPARLDAELGDQQVNDVGERDETGREVHAAEGDRFGTGSRVEGRETTGKVDMGIGDRAETNRVPVVSENLSFLGVDESIPIRGGSDPV